jgi:hypothetical protein
MTDSAVSPDGRWRWEHDRWVPTEQSWSHQGQNVPSVASAHEAHTAGRGITHALATPALITTLLSVAIIVFQTGSDTVEAFGDGYSGTPFFYSIWFTAAQALIGGAAVAMAAICLKDRITWVAAMIFSIASVTAFQGVLALFYRVVVYHFGYGESF